MANCTVKIYYKSNIQMDKNFYIEDIETYLSNKTIAATIQNYQYQKIEPILKIKLDSKSAPFNTDAENVAASIYGQGLSSYYYDYCSIKDSSDNKIYYYFIVDRKALANGTIEFTLNMDTINTFQVDIRNTANAPLSFNKKTQIIRQHENRFYSEKVNNAWKRKIHFVSEGIQPLLYKQSEYEINNDNRKWYIINNTVSSKPNADTDANSTIETYYCSDSPYSFYAYGKAVLGETEINALINQAGDKSEKYLFFGEQFNVNFNIQIDDKIINNRGNWAITTSPVESTFYLIKSNSLTRFRNDEYIKFKTLKILESTTFIGNSYNYVVNNVEYRLLAVEANNIVVGPTLETKINTINSVQDIVRTKPTLNKIIEIPYCPFNEIKKDNKNYLPDYLETSSVDLGSSNLTLIHVKNYNIYENSSNTIESNIKDKSFMFVSGSVSDYSRNDNLESKIYHSDFYYNKFLYDSFSLNLNYENLDEIGIKNENLSFNFVCTKTLNSKFLFKINNFPLKYSMSDYDNILTVARNNEIPLLNSAYINYIKNGYNYDVKNRERQELARNITTGLSIAASAGSLASAIATGGITLPLVIASISGTAGIIMNNINSSIQAEQGLEQKLNQLKNQSANVIGSDDIDIMRYYTNQKAKLVNYTVSEEMKKNLLDLFYYRGYLVNKQGIPNCISRKNFNFIQCEPVFDIGNINISQEILNNLKERYKLGVSIIHNFNNSWDIEQTSGNLETFMS